MQMTITLTDAEAAALKARTGKRTAPAALRTLISEAIAAPKGATLTRKGRTTTMTIHNPNARAKAPLTPEQCQASLAAGGGVKITAKMRKLGLDETFFYGP